LEVFWDCAWTGLKSLKFLDCSNLISPEFQQSGRLQNCITPKPWTISGKITVGKRKEYYITIVLRFWSDSRYISSRMEFSNCRLHSSQIWHRCPSFHFFSFLPGFEDAHLSWYFHSMMWCSSYICDGYFRRMGFFYMAISLKHESHWRNPEVASNAWTILGIL
jgi:hypothetical protein